MQSYIEQIVFNGYVEKEFYMGSGENRIPYTLRTINHEDQKEVDRAMSDVPENANGAYITRTYISELLARTLVKFGEIEFDSREKCLAFLSKKPDSFVNIISKKQGVLEKEVQVEMSEGDIEETFSETPSTEPDSNQK